MKEWEELKYQIKKHSNTSRKRNVKEEGNTENGHHQINRDERKSKEREHHKNKTIFESTHSSRNLIKGMHTLVTTL